MRKTPVWAPPEDRMKGTKMAYRELDPEMVLKMYKKYFDEGRPSLARVAKELADMGITTRTGNPPTRQGVHYSLRSTEEGKALLKLVSERRRL